MATRRSPKEIVDLFKVVMKDAAKMFAKPESEVTDGQFLAAANGRLGKDSIKRLGVSFGVLRNHLYPSSKGKIDKQSNEMIKRILGLANGKK